MGLKMRYVVTTAELRDHCDNRITHYTKLAQEAEAEIEKEEAEMEKMLGAAKTVTDRFAIKNSGDFTQALNDRHSARSTAEECWGKIRDFTFRRDHLPPGEVLSLTESDLQRLEMMGGRFSLF